MRKGVLVLFVVGLVIVSASAGYLVGTSTSQNTTATNTAIPITLPNSVCTVPIPHVNQSLTTEVYQVALYSIGVVCIAYEFQGNRSYSLPLEAAHVLTSAGVIDDIRGVGLL